MWPRSPKKSSSGIISRLLSTLTPRRDFFPKGPYTLFEPEDVAVDIVFIHSLTENRDEAWKPTDSNDPWPKQLLPDQVAKARIVAFGYDVGKMRKLGDMLDSENLKKCAKEFLDDYPLRLSSTSPSDALQGGTQEKIQGVFPTPVGIERPAIFVAHGFGGLVYEQALALSHGSNTEGKSRRHAAILLDTPHHGAGLAEWAVMCAQRLGIPCADTAQKQDWSDCKSQITSIDDMQRIFRSVIRKQIKVNIAACYATRFVPNSKLHLASEWVVLPDFEPIPIDKSHFEMTKLNGEDPAFFNIAKLLHKWAEELRSKSFEDEEPPSPRDPLSDMRKIFANVKPQPNLPGNTSVPGKGPQEPEDRPPNVSRSGITVLYSKGKESKVDIVLVHGLNGDPEKTWTHSDTKFFWPWDLRKHFPDARVMVYGYDVDLSPQPTRANLFEGPAQTLLRSLVNQRKDDSVLNRPLVFIGHSLGGIVVKNALVLASRAPTNEVDAGRLISATKGIVFFGTPNADRNASIKAQVLLNIAMVAFTNVSPKLIPNLLHHSEELLALDYAFRSTVNTLKQVEICSCVETLKTPKVGALVVDEYTALIGIENEETVFLEADHENMVKFTDEKDGNYERVRAIIQRIERRAISVGSSS